MTTWIWSDLHIGHVACATKWRLWAGGTVEAHDATIMDAWKSRVQPEDDIWILGDVAMGDLAESLEKVGSLPGRKLLVAGNHDRVSFAYEATSKVSDGQRIKWAAMYDEVFDFIVPWGTYLTENGVVFSHYPWSDVKDHGDGERDLIERFGPHREEYPYPEYVLLHGHLHSISQAPVFGAIHVGVDAWQDGPVDLATLV